MEYIQILGQNTLDQVDRFPLFLPLFYRPSSNKAKNLSINFVVCHVLLLISFLTCFVIIPIMFTSPYFKFVSYELIIMFFPVLATFFLARTPSQQITMCFTHDDTAPSSRGTANTELLSLVADLHTEDLLIIFYWQIEVSYLILQFLCIFTKVSNMHMQ